MEDLQGTLPFTAGRQQVYFELWGDDFFSQTFDGKPSLD